MSFEIAFCKLHNSIGNFSTRLILFFSKYFAVWFELLLVAGLPGLHDYMTTYMYCLLGCSYESSLLLASAHLQQHLRMSKKPGQPPV